MHNILEGNSYSAAYRMGDYKLISGYAGSLNDWYLQDGTTVADTSFTYTGTNDYYLFDLSSKCAGDGGIVHGWLGYEWYSY